MKLRAISDAQAMAMPGWHFGKKLLLIMKLTFLILIVAILHVSADVRAQKVTLKASNSKLEHVLDNIRKQTGYDIFYNTRAIQQANRVTVSMKSADLKVALDQIFESQPFNYSIEDKSVVIKLVNKSNLSNSKVATQQQRAVSGRVQNVKGERLPNITLNFISAGGSQRIATNVTTSEQGTFQFDVTPGIDSVRFTSVGYISKTMAIPNYSPWIVTLVQQTSNISEVIVTGMMERSKATFTGAVSSFNADDLKAIGNTNVIQSLRSLDPSFLLMEQNLSGSNPNRLATIELRGQTSINLNADELRDEYGQDPNQPLFILDGFETNLATITNLDINRIQSITLLKDAASTAIYGSRASNGVVVVETIQPKVGEINLNYSTDWNIESPDLTSYNMMNAAEKLEFERLSGRYTNHNRTGQPINQMELDQLYSNRLQDVLRGMDSYWLSDPLRTGISQRHSLQVTGGEKSLTYVVGGDYRKANGAMIGSGRDTWGGRLNLSYRTQKLTINNNLYVSGYNAKESPYGEFQTWVNMNPYLEKHDENTRYLLDMRNPYTGERERVSNPFYTASLGNFDRTESFTLTNNLQARYKVNSALQLSTSLQVIKNELNRSIFSSPRDNEFIETDVLLRGRLNSTDRGSLSYTLNFDASYGKTFGMHLINAYFRTELSNNQSTSEGYTALGFPTASNGNPRFAYGYGLNGRPAASTSLTRRHSLVTSFNYSFNQRYNADVSFTYDGSTAFGAQNLYSPFYSGGLSWNIHNEQFMKDNVSWIDMLRLRGNIGITGNQNFSSYSSMTVYDYTSVMNSSGIGAYVTALGNEHLAWQNTIQTSLGLDLNMFNNRITTQFNVYRKYTDPLVVTLPLPPSTALNNYPINSGNLTTDGMELMVRFAPIYKPKEQIIWNVGLMGSTYKSTYDGFGGMLESLNQSLRTSRSLQKFRDGGDPNDIWAVPSLGIDPATGGEIFLKKDGRHSFQHDYKDEAVVGNSRASFTGTINNTVTYKNFSASVIMRYILDQDVFNTALFNKVENITMSQLIQNNQDKRALYERWQEVGDIAQFRRIQLNDYNISGNNITGVDESTRPSSRFVQNMNALSLESVSLTYQFRNQPWLKSAHLKNLKVSAYLNDLFYLSTVRRERGINYPYARNVSFSLSANF